MPGLFIPTAVFYLPILSWWPIPLSFDPFPWLFPYSNCSLQVLVQTGWLFPRVLLCFNLPFLLPKRSPLCFAFLFVFFCYVFRQVSLLAQAGLEFAVALLPSGSWGLQAWATICVCVCACTNSSVQVHACRGQRSVSGVSLMLST